MLYSDLHIHSRFARATSKNLTVLELAKWSKIKGIYLLGTGDIYHPAWLDEFEKFTQYDFATGFYKLKPELESEVKKQVPKSVADSPVYFVPTVETSHIYKQGDLVRRIHIVTIVKDLKIARQISNKLATYSRVDADGRPIFGMRLPDYVKLVLEFSEENLVFPAHVWTPHFAVFGSKSGFDRLEDAFEDTVEYITALETGLSSDPEMNRLISGLDKYVLISNSDAHSAPRIGREANIHISLANYNELINTLKTGQNLYGTVEYYPEEGRYHYDGHRACNVSMHPKEAKANNNICPVCKKPLTLGVLHRVYDLADREVPNQELLTKYKTVSLVPLDDILSNVLAVGKSSKRLQAKLMEVIDKLGPELKVLHELPVEEILKYDPKLACAIRQMRNGDLKIEPGYDGVYGKVNINLEPCKKTLEPDALQLPI